MNKVLIIGAGGVSNVVVQKCASVPEVFGEIVLASRTVSKCDEIAERVKRKFNRTIKTEKLDADNVSETVALIRKHQPNLVINVALPYQDLNIMNACLETGVDYIDTANYEPLDTAKFEYKWQWDYQDKYKNANIMALLGSGFDPGTTNVFCAYAQKHLFDEIHTVDIVDCNGGDHGKAFATNFNPEINIREVTARGRYFEGGEWKSTDPLSVHQPFDFPGVGVREMYLMYHEEMESLAKNIKGVKRMRFWMTFGQEYLTHLRVLQNVGMTRIDEVEYNGQKIVPLQFLKTVLPDPGSLAENYTGKTSIGCVIEGLKDGQFKRVFIYNICDHAETYKEVEAQAVSYTTGVPAMIGAKMMLTKKWQKAGVYNMEEFDPDPFMDDLNKYGLPWQVVEWNSSVE
ncbi:MAG: saccharopine dehydrogenase [Bacteroidetes bacterium GWF2_42_66]|nr:MAG: saccharopine dehydrogenase [Bacteroidetes bacterium GWA2_42_15]OFY02511.1 MAG: saccharopine dehydrogenase [Bacteroidetes bacterium GWE2_42_39]OFY41391.1 MAG: saccharopine dehydrogenase [Bacteroidetes bacterium GWF2_42_66]HBL75405.1 saccharopine dehydrogenase [Prolixibacteraceae bacterium]HCU60686.1 saccharopine dehydrogenase [Prolixibacteraceae bacterium]